MAVMPELFPVRKPMCHRPPFPADDAWYFITICAAGHHPWKMTKPPDGRAVAPRPPQSCDNECAVGKSIASPSFADIATIILNEVRENHVRGIWRLSLFLVMPDHIHAIVHFPAGDRSPAAFDLSTTSALDRECVSPEAKPSLRSKSLEVCGHGVTALPLQHCPVGMARIVANFKRLLSARYGLAFQRDFFDTRIRDDAHYAEKFKYVCANPVRKGLCATPRDWPHVIAFDRATGEELPHR